jgi:LacI family transcriptional regulator
MAGKKATLQEIADKLGISKITVSRALKGQSGVSDTLRREIRLAASETGYRIEKLKNEEKSKTFVFLTSDRLFLAPPSDSFQYAVASRLRSLCREKRDELFLEILDKDEERRGSLPPYIGRAAGVFMGGEIGKPVTEALQRLRIPRVAVDFNVLDHTADSVVTDNYLSGSMAAEYLIRQGYGKIGFVGSPAQGVKAADQLHGFLRTVETRKLIFREEWIINNYNADTDTYTLDFPMPRQMPEAFVLNGRQGACYFIEKLKIEGFTVPGDVALIKIEDLGLAEGLPSVTGIRTDEKKFAEMCLSLMQERIAGRTTMKRVYIPTEIAERNSTPLKTGHKRLLRILPDIPFDMDWVISCHKAEPVLPLRRTEFTLQSFPSGGK